MENKFTEEYLGTPYTFENSTNPWLMDTKVHKPDVIRNYDGELLTAKYMWSLDSEKRIKTLEYVFHHLKEHGFPYTEMTKEEIVKDLESLKNLDTNKLVRSDGYISNSINTGLNLCQIICPKEYFSAKGDASNSHSLMDIFNDDDMLIKVLKNRMGWNVTKEDGTERPYLFPVSYEQIRRGIRNSGLGYAVSNFRPSITKFIYDKYLKEGDNIFDYSCGWGARALSSIGKYNYVGTDPLTADKINEWFDKHISDHNVRCIKQGSEIYIPEYDGKMDMCMSCPPYFTLEKYSDDKSQSYNMYSDYEDWVNEYWKSTVENCYYYLKDGGYFILIIKNNHKKYNLKEDMSRIILEQGFKYKEELVIFNMKNHLSGKSKSKNSTKQNEYILVYTK